MLLIYYLFIVGYNLIGSIRAEEQPIAHTRYGSVVGYFKTSFEGRKFAAFEGIPYAEAPVGPLRFEESRPAKPWTGLWNSSVVHRCLQVDYPTDNIIGSEDCLYINIYVPKQTVDPTDNLEVVVHIHGGAFMFGSPDAYTLPDYLVDRNFIFATMSYRLGILGFLSTGDDVLPGNNGLKDQNLALRWIKNNIASFGGNPNSITLTGFSAGGASTHYQLLSPKSRGLFNRGISHSGCAFAPWGLHDDPMNFAQKLANLMGCPIFPSRQLVDCIRQRSPVQILTKLRHFLRFEGMPLGPVGPVVENNKNGFLPKHPYVLLQEGAVQDIPWLFSTVSQEGQFPGFLYQNRLDHLDRHWTDLAPYFLEFHNTQPKHLWPETAEAIRDFYFGKGGRISTSTYTEYLQMLTDRLFTVEVETAAKLQSKATTAPVFYYLFEFRGNTTFTDLFDYNLPQKAVCHGDDIIHLYGNVVPNNHPDERDVRMIHNMLDMMESFTKTNAPSFGSVQWPPTNTDDLTYLHIKGPDDAEVKVTKELAAVSFWRSHGFNELDMSLYPKDEL